MKISYNWLKQFLKIDWNAERTGELLTDLGLEVEGIAPFESVKGGLKGVVVGHVLECKKHPNADKLKLTKVDIGEEEPVQIVCGAPNVAKGQKVPVATIGTTLYDAEDNAWTIKKGKIRGEASYGMICAEDELGLGTGHDGIMVLDEDLKPGTPCDQVFAIENDEVFEIGLTPNRADAMSHFGVARDLRAGLIQQDVNLELITPSVTNFKVENRMLRFDIDVQDKERCPRYCGVTISNVKVADSPAWLQNKLKAIGLSPINNIVDATNYVLHELGQPLHAFDADKIAGKKIVVRTLKGSPTFVTLDEVERTLHEEDLMICDGEETPLCIAGVFGGINSGVTSETRNIFLESAYFDPVSVRKTAKRHGLNTDASFRFERGIDINGCDYAMIRAALLIQELAGGDITSDPEDVYPVKKEDFQVVLNYDKVDSLVGQEIPRETIKSILTSLDIKVNNVTESGIGITIPSYRVDVQREVDVIEEILRVYGYNTIAFTQKLNASISNVSRFDDHRIQNIIGNQLAASGFYEIMTNSLTRPDYTALAKNLEESNSVLMLNPLSNELSAMRQSMLFSGLESVSFNLNRQRNDLKFFEFGKTYRSNADTREESKHLSLFITGNRDEESWTNPQQASSFFYLKGMITSIVERLGIDAVKTTPVDDAIFSEGLTISSGKNPLVSFGVVNKGTLKAFDIKQEVLYADFDWDNVLQVAAHSERSYKEISKYPKVRRDLALLLDEQVSFAEVHKLAHETERKLLKEVSLFDVYKGKNLPKGKKSYAVSFILQDENKTLTDKQIDKIMGKLQSTYQNKVGAELR